MPVSAALASNQDILPLRVRYRAEANAQVVHDSLHTRAGWTKSYLLQVDARGRLWFRCHWRTVEGQTDSFRILSVTRSARAWLIFKRLLQAAPIFRSADQRYPVDRDAPPTVPILQAKIVYRDELMTSLPAQV
jgi:hypothetical protein